MGQAKLRGTFEERRATAKIKAKTEATQPSVTGRLTSSHLNHQRFKSHSRLSPALIATAALMLAADTEIL